MNGSEALDQVTGAGLELAQALAELPASQGAATDEELVARLRVLGGVLRLVEGALLNTVGEVQERSSSADRGARMTTRIGCRTVAEVIERAAGVSDRSARQWVRAAGLITQSTDLSGAVLPGLFPAVAEAARCGVLGTDGILAIAGVLNDAAPRIGVAAIQEAERIAMLKRGITLGAPVGGLVPIRGALLPETAAQLQLLLDAYNNPSAPPIPEPFAATNGDPAVAGGITSGAIPAPSGVRFHDSSQAPASSEGDVDAHSCVCGAQDANGALATALPEDGAPVGDYWGTESGSAMTCVCLPSRADDRRTPAQKRHDALSAMLRIAAESGRAPTLQGHAPTLLVRISSSALTQHADAQRHSDAGAGEELGTDPRMGTIRGNLGTAHRPHSAAQAELPGLEIPISVATALRITCTGGIQHVHYDLNQAITAISSEARIFTPTQRRAINDRDRECIIPGCHVPASWCEHHHVTEWANGGATHTSNGVAICFHHHRTLEQSGWRIRIRDGVPEVQAPLLWDPHQRWIRKPHHRGLSRE